MPHREAALTLVAAGSVALDTERALHEVLDRLGPSVFAGLLDADGVLRYANQAALQAIGSAPEQVLGQPFDATPWWQALRVVAAAAAAGDGKRNARRSLAFRRSHRQERRRHVGHGLLAAAALRAGWPRRWLIPSACDVSEREQAQRQLLLTRHAVEQSNDALFQVGPDGSFRDANAAACRLLGLEREPLLRLRVADVDTQVDDGEVAAALARDVRTRVAAIRDQRPPSRGP